MNHSRTPTKITLDAYAGSHRAVLEIKETETAELPRGVKVRSSQYLSVCGTPRVEQGHRESNTGFPRCWDSNDSTTRQASISGIELAEKIKKV
jgi:hypothetical protein